MNQKLTDFSSPVLVRANRVGSWCETPFHCYLNYWEGKPVSTAEILLGKEVVGINGVTTLPEACGMGLTSLTTIAALLDARKKGYRIGTLQATKMGFEHNFNLWYFTCAL